MTDTLSDLRTDFPGYVIDTEAVTNGKRYVAVRRQPGPGPHTVVTPDLAELRAALAAAVTSPPATP
jgi:hypothetical protein